MQDAHLAGTVMFVRIHGLRPMVIVVAPLCQVIERVQRPLFGSDALWHVEKLTPEIRCIAAQFQRPGQCTAPPLSVTPAVDVGGSVELSGHWRAARSRLINIVV